MLNYYHLLKISDLCNDAEVITMAYRRAIAEKAHGNESDDGFRERICCVTEAYLVLSDMLLKIATTTRLAKARRSTMTYRSTSRPNVPRPRLLSSHASGRAARAYPSHIVRSVDITSR